MRANTNYAQQERPQLGHMLKSLPMPRPPLSHSYLHPPFGPVEDHLALQSTVCVCVVGSWGLASVFSSLLMRINEIAFISMEDVEI